MVKNAGFNTDMLYLALYGRDPSQDVKFILENV